MTGPECQKIVTGETDEVEKPVEPDGPTYGCPRCGGYGWLRHGAQCPTCNGRGWTRQEYGPRGGKWRCEDYKGSVSR